MIELEPNEIKTKRRSRKVKKPVLKSFKATIESLTGDGLLSGQVSNLCLAVSSGERYLETTKTGKGGKHQIC